jgi:hypothetical protein
MSCYCRYLGLFAQTHWLSDWHAELCVDRSQREPYFLADLLRNESLVDRAISGKASSLVFLLSSAEDWFDIVAVT